MAAFPDAFAPAASRERLLALAQVAFRAGMHVAVGGMMASRLVRRSAEEAAHYVFQL